MSDAELLTDTNRLLQRLLDIDEAKRKEAEASKGKMEARLAEFTTKREEAMKTRLEGLGVPPDLAAASEESIVERHETAQRKAKENIATVQSKNAEYQDSILKEMQTQSDLLRRIAARLEA